MDRGEPISNVKAWISGVAKIKKDLRDRYIYLMRLTEASNIVRAYLQGTTHERSLLNNDSAIHPMLHAFMEWCKLDLEKYTKLWYTNDQNELIDFVAWIVYQAANAEESVT